MEKDRHRGEEEELKKRQAENKNNNNSQEANKPANRTSRQNAQGGGKSSDA